MDEESKAQSSQKHLDAPSTSNANKKIKKRGVLYLSSVPEGMTVAYICDLLQAFGEIGRTYFKPYNFSLKRKTRVYEEGWIEFMDRKAAKNAAKSLNTQVVPGGKVTKFYHITYLYVCVYMGLLCTYHDTDSALFKVL